MTQAALKDFLSSDGWEVGVDGSVALVEFGAGKDFDTTNIKDPIIGFIFGNKGLMCNFSLEGSKMTKIRDCFDNSKRVQETGGDSSSYLWIS